jgi:hypothetical protein
MFAGGYNQDRPLRERLRPQHAKLFARVLTLLARHYYNNNRLFRDTPGLRQVDASRPQVLATNRKALSWVEKTLQINGNTVYRQLLRLVDAGVIAQKVNHGSQMNFELWINPGFLLINDLENPGHTPSSKYLESGNAGTQPSLNTSFPPGSLIPEKELSNNLNIDVDKVSLPTVRDALVKEPERTAKKNPEKEHWGMAQGPGSGTTLQDGGPSRFSRQWKEKEQGVAPAGATKLREYQKGAARWFFAYVMDRLFEGRGINPAHLENTLDYVERHYFTQCPSFKAVEQVRKVFQWRIDKARRTIDRHGTDMRWVFPGHYLDTARKGTNPKTGKPYMSFANTAGWPKRFEHLHRARQDEKRKKDDMDRLDAQFRTYLGNPTLEQFRRCEAYVKKNIPQLMGHFLSWFSPLNAPGHA